MGTTDSSAVLAQPMHYSMGWLKTLSLVREMGACRSLMIDPQTDRQYLILTSTFASEEEAKKYGDQMKKKYLWAGENNPSTPMLNAHQFHVNPLAHLTFTMSNICSKHHQFIQVFDFQDCSYTLHDEILSRRKNCHKETAGNSEVNYKENFNCDNEKVKSNCESGKVKFNCKEIWSILCSCVLPMAHFTRLQVSHLTLTPRDIVLSADGLIKIVPTQISHFYHCVHGFIPQELDDDGNQFFYYAPEMLRKTSSFQSNNKEAIFTLGLTILSVILCQEDLTDLYIVKQEKDGRKMPNNTYKLDGSRLQQLVDGIGSGPNINEEESEMFRSIKEVLRKMLKIAAYERISFTELEEMLYDILEKNEQYIQWDEAEYHPQKPGQDERLDTQSCRGVEKLEESIYRLRAQNTPHAVKNQKCQRKQRCQTRTNPSPVDEQDCGDSGMPSTANNQQQTQNIDEEKLHEYADIDGNTNEELLKNLDVNRVEATLNKDTSKKKGSKKDGDSIRKGPSFSDISHKNVKSTKSTQIQKLKKISNLQPYIDSKSLQNDKENLMNSGIHPIREGRKSSSLKSDSVQVEEPAQFKNTFRDTESVSSNSHGYYVTEQYSRGKYEGYKNQHMRNGFGTFYYEEGGKYSGEWVNNQMHGRGALYYSNGELAYEGEWRGDMLHGYGVLYNEAPVYITSTVDFSQLDKISSCWVKYEGYFQHDKKEGQGTLYLSNGEWFRGNFKGDLPEGVGIFKDMNGRQTQGFWHMGILQGDIQQKQTGALRMAL